MLVYTPWRTSGQIAASGRENVLAVYQKESIVPLVMGKFQSCLLSLRGLTTAGVTALALVVTPAAALASEVPGTPGGFSPTCATTPTWSWNAADPTITVGDNTGTLNSYVLFWSSTYNGEDNQAFIDPPATSFTHSTPLAVGTWYAKVVAVYSFPETEMVQSFESDIGSITIISCQITDEGGEEIPPGDPSPSPTPSVVTQTDTTGSSGSSTVATAGDPGTSGSTASTNDLPSSGPSGWLYFASILGLSGLYFAIRRLAR